MSHFAFANIKGDICLVQGTYLAQISRTRLPMINLVSALVALPTPGAMSSALMASDVRVFRHEFITIFRYSHSATVHPADIHVLEPVDERGTVYEEEKGTVFLARDVMDRLQKLIAGSRPSMRRYPGARPCRVNMTKVH